MLLLESSEKLEKLIKMLFEKDLILSFHTMIYCSM